MKSLIKIFSACIFALALHAQDAELSNNFSGISLTFGIGDGSDRGTAYVVEYPYHDQLTKDSGIVYIRDTTAILMAHNAWNNVAQHDGAPTPSGKFRIIGINGLDGVPASGDEGIIRYRVDREGQVGALSWTPYLSGGATATFPAYTAPITFAGLTYQSGVPVVGTTGIGSGYQRGILDATGDEWHVIAVGDDDAAHETGPSTEQQASDGKIYHFVVNPKAPAMTVRATGNAQFYTTPAKVYLAAKVHSQTTYIQPGSGTVTFELRDIYNRNISYRINGGSWVSVGANNITLSATDFSTGSNTLEYRSAGFEANAKTRTVVKNPTHPSLAESHGHFLWGNSTELAKITARLTRAPYLTAWNYINTNSVTKLTEWDLNGATANRQPFMTATALSTIPLPTPQESTAFIGLVRGFDAVPPGGYTRSWGSYAKDQLLRGIWTRVDAIDYERNHSDGANPATEVMGAGYYHVNTVYANVIAYDIIAGHYRSDQNAAGLTPIEDYFIRDVLASAVNLTNYTILGGTHGTGVTGAAMGLWYGARSVGSTMVAQCMKEYSTPYYGTSGYGTVQTQYTYTPHPTFSPTWKSIYATTPAQSATVPGTTVPSLTLDDPDLWQPGGVWGGPNLGYFSLMRKSFCISQNLNARYSPTTVYPYMAAGLQAAINGTLTTIASPTGQYYAQPTLGNSVLGALGASSVADLKARGTESSEIFDKLLLALIWYDDSGSPSSPATPRAGRKATPAASGLLF